MPAYNAERYIGRAIESVLRQTMREWEIVVVDDGSTDATADILHSYDDPRIRVIRQENQGEAGARNTGLREVLGEYVAFLDSDDLFLPSALSDQTEFLEAHPEFDVSYSDGYFCDENDEPMMRLSEIRPMFPNGRILEEIVLSSAVITVPVCTMIRRVVLNRSGVGFDKALVIGPDWDFWIRLARHARFGYLDKPTCLYRVHESNISKTAGRRKRNLDLARVRLKVVNAEWFSELSPGTQQALFHEILVVLLDGEPEEQAAVLGSNPFAGLPPGTRAPLLRRTAAAYLERGEQVPFAVGLLAEAVHLHPNDRMSQALLRMANADPALAGLLVRWWREVATTRSRLRTLGHRRPQPVPPALLPQK